MYADHKVIYTDRSDAEQIAAKRTNFSIIFEQKHAHLWINVDKSL